MSPSIILDSDLDEIQAAMAIALLQHKTANGLTYEKIGKVIGREKQSVQQYISSDTDMPASCWLKAVAMWPDLADRLAYHLDEAEKAFRTHQSTLGMDLPVHRRPPPERELEGRR